MQAKSNAARWDASVATTSKLFLPGSLLLPVPELSAQRALTLPDGLPEWAFNIPDEDAAYGPPRPEGIVRVPGSAVEYDAAEIAGSATPPDWFPDAHPPAPQSVTGGPGIQFACGACHLMSGQGHPESADLAGLPVEYFVRQMAYYKAGARKEEDRMGLIAQLTSDEDVREAAEYFAALTPTTFVEVIETATPPKTFIATQGRHRQLDPAGGTEPIGRRILQVPADPFGTAIRDPRAGFIAYVPPGSIARGKSLVEGDTSDKTVQCALCHGEAQLGLGEVPRLAGLQPRYIARQLFLMRHGSSAGKAAELMKRVVANLTDDDIIAISAYLGSLPPR